MGIIGRVFGVFILFGSGWTLVRIYRSTPSDNFILLAFLFFLTVLGFWLLIGASVSLFRAFKDRRRLQH